ncbi:sporulation histidine kinase inhibitor Sda [Bacillaceae bacterium S4-13-58]
MKNISDELLVEAYLKAWLLEMDCEFIHLLELEIEKRGIDLKELVGKAISKRDY